jgi:hypothetical protein
MASPTQALYGYKFMADVLQPLQLVVWGEVALGYLGVPTGLNVRGSCTLTILNLITLYNGTSCSGSRMSSLTWLSKSLSLRALFVKVGLSVLLAIQKTGKTEPHWQQW